MPSKTILLIGVFLTLVNTLWSQCTLPSQTTITIILQDSFGDGWGGAQYTISDFSTGSIVAIGTLEDGEFEEVTLCLQTGCYSFSVTGGDFPEEISWSIDGADSPVTGGAPTETFFSVNGGICDGLGCTNPTSCNFWPLATIDDGSCSESLFFQTSGWIAEYGNYGTEWILDFLILEDKSIVLLVNDYLAYQGDTGTGSCSGFGNNHVNLVRYSPNGDLILNQTLGIHNQCNTSGLSYQNARLDQTIEGNLIVTAYDESTFIPYVMEIDMGGSLISTTMLETVSSEYPLRDVTFTNDTIYEVHHNNGPLIVETVPGGSIQVLTYGDTGVGGQGNERGPLITSSTDGQIFVACEHSYYQDKQIAVYGDIGAFSEWQIMCGNPLRYNKLVDIQYVQEQDLLYVFCDETVEIPGASGEHKDLHYYQVDPNNGNIISDVWYSVPHGRSEIGKPYIDDQLNIHVPILYDSDDNEDGTWGLDATKIIVFDPQGDIVEDRCVFNDANAPESLFIIDCFVLSYDQSQGDCYLVSLELLDSNSEGEQVYTFSNCIDENIYALSGHVYLDFDSNQIFEPSANEIPLSQQIVELDYGSSKYYSSTNQNGSYTYFSDGSPASINYIPDNGFIETSDTYSIALENYLPNEANLNFGVAPEFTKGDLTIDLQTTAYVCNESSNVVINVKNVGTEGIAGFDVELWVNSQTTVQAQDPNISVFGNYLLYSTTDTLQPYIFYQEELSIEASLNLPDFTFMGDLLIDSARVTPHEPFLIEQRVDNNFAISEQPLLCSYDPNDKLVNPEKCQHNPGDTLSYTIRFQNTGNYSASRVRLVDTLDQAQLNILDFQALNSSHSCEWQINSPSILEVVFDNINLPDSTTSFEESQGFFKFGVTIRDELVSNEPSSSSAHIFFDYNPAVVTNAPQVGFGPEGCTDSTACNYDVQANCDNGSCEYLTCQGCTNPQACNFDESATIDNNSCEYPAELYLDCAGNCLSDLNQNGVCDEIEVAGCTDTTACNFNPIANSDNGSCTYPGCVDPNACNYVDDAGCDDGTCEFDSCAGCTNPNACNYQFSATIDDGSCDFSSCAGCTNPNACNFDITATIDNGQCEFLSCAGCTNPNACNWDPSATLNDGSCEYFTCSGCTDPSACNWQPSASIDDGSCVYPVTPFTNCAGECINDSNGNGVCDEEEISGCMDPMACNFDLEATINDDSCIYPNQEYLNCDGSCLNDSDGDGVCDEAEIIGCTDNLACNYEPEATESSFCTYPEQFYLDCSGSCINDSDQDGVCDEIEVPGCTDQSACNFLSTATELDESCEYPMAEYLDCEGQCLNDIDLDGICDEIEVFGCKNPIACNFNPLATEDDGSCSYPGCLDPEACNFDDSAGCSDDTCTYPGCQDEFACNYDSNAGCDSGQCTYPGCIDVNACNYDETAGCDDGSCNYVGSFEIEGVISPVLFQSESYSYQPTEGSTYEWSCDGGLIIEGDGTSEIQVIWGEEGLGQVCVIETTQDSCVGTQVCLDLIVIPTSTNDLTSGELEIFPNPSSSHLTIRLSTNIENGVYELFDQQGKCVLRGQLKSLHNVVDVKSIASGNYSLLISSGKAHVVKMVVISH